MFKKLLLIVLLVVFSSCLYARGPFGKALYLDGNQQYFSIPDTTYLNVGNDEYFAIEFWYKPDSDKECNLVNKVLFEYEKSMCFYIFRGWFADMYRSLIVPDTLDISSYYINPCNLFEGFYSPKNFRFVFGYADDKGGSKGSSERISIVESNVWQHLVIQFTSNRKIKIFENGMSLLERGYGFDLSSPGCSLNIGGFHIKIDSTLHSSVYFKGFIDEVRIWKDYINAPTMNDTLGPEYYLSSDKELLAYYRFDELEDLGVGNDDLTDDIRDLTYNGNHGDLVGEAVLVDTDLLADVESDFSELPVLFDLLRYSWTGDRDTCRRTSAVRCVQSYMGCR
jgi:hypothetical protein